MKQELTVQQRTALNTKLDRLAQAALRAHERAKQCAATLVQNMARSGEALCKARDLCDNAAWEDFLLNKFKVSKTTAYRYMYIAKHWARLQAIAPPEALTSLRKATRLLDSLLLGEAAADGSKRRRKKRASPTLELPAPSASGRQLSPAAAVAAVESVDAARSGLERMYRDMHRVLIDLSDELSQMRPPSFEVRNAQDALDRARLHFEDARSGLFASAATSSPAK